MAYIREEEINKIRQAADIVDIISDYITLQPQGKNYVALCPFHNDVNHPSLVVSPERQIFNCFSCPAGGNVFSFVMKKEEVGFIEAVEIVAKKIGYNLHIDKTKSDNVPLKKEYEMYNLATKFFENNLATEKGHDAREYLANRGITADIIKEFHIGLALTGKDDLYQLLLKKKYSLDEIVDLGLANKAGVDIYDTFTNRIMIPISNMQGEVVAFTGRIYHNEDAAKYINTRETKIFKKGNILFNFANAKKAIKTAGEVIIVEGHMDAIMLSAKGIKNVIALMGVALSNEHIKELQKLRVPVVLMLDNDDAGLTATVEVGQKLLDSKIDTKVVRLSEVKDPDEYMRKFGFKALEDNIKHAPSYINFKLNYLKQNKDLQTIPDVVKYVKEVLSSLGQVDEITKDAILGDLSKEYNIDKEILKQNIKYEVKEPVKEEIVAPKRHTRYEKAANYILYAMMNEARFIRIFKEKLGFLKNRSERIIVSQIVYYNNSYGDINLADFTSFIQNDEEIFNKVMEIVNNCQDLEINIDEFNKYLEVILRELKLDEIKNLKMQLKNEMDMNKKIEILTKIAELKKEV